MFAPRRATKAELRITKLLGNTSLGHGLQFHATGVKNRMIAVSCGQGDFYDPMDGLRRAILMKAEEEAQTGECRSVESSTVSVTPLDKIENNHQRANYRSAMKRVPRGFIRMWVWKGDGSIGWFFLYPAKVLFVGWAKTRRWFNKVVPPEGLSVAELSNP
jgi:hypothetical protein